MVVTLGSLTFLRAYILKGKSISVCFLDSWVETAPGRIQFIQVQSICTFLVVLSVVASELRGVLENRAPCMLIYLLPTEKSLHVSPSLRETGLLTAPARCGRFAHWVSEPGTARAFHLRIFFWKVLFNVMLSCDLSGFSLLMVGHAPYPLVVMLSC